MGGVWREREEKTSREDKNEFDKKEQSLFS